VTNRSTALRLSLFAIILLAVLLPMSGCKGTIHRLRIKFQHRKATSKANTTDYADNVENLLESAQLPSLRWPDYAPDQAVVHGFYDDRDDELAWTRDGKPTGQATRLMQMFGDAATKGLEPEDYDASRWAARVSKLAEIAKKKDTSDAAQDAVAQFDVAMTICAVRYLEDLHVGRINPQALNFDIDTPAKRAAFDVQTLLNDDLVDAKDVPSVVAGVEPQNTFYKATEAALPGYLMLERMQSASQQQPLPPLSAGTKPIAVGGLYGALQPLLVRLQMEGDAPRTMAGSTIYTAELSAAVKHYQDRHGLQDDGKLGQATIDSLNVPISVRVQQMDDALERWRWLPDNYQQPRVFANLPEFLLRTYNADHALAFKMRVVDGEAEGNHDTPMFVRMMRYVVFRPYWNLPPSIVKKEIMKHIRSSGMGYLASHDYEAYNNSGAVVTNATADDIDHLRVSVRQKPGPKNSLGLVKFLFPNDYDVYMHSTPELNLFALTRRDRSHGCVRLQHADQMAQWVLSNDQPNGGWDQDKVDDAMNGDDNNKTINLKSPLPVLIGYFTAMADEDGSMHFFDDIYGYDKQMEAALAKGRPYEREEMKVNPKLTPGETE
jgi:murein L,D-transpeptidase YcbB/YkuD